MSQPRQSSRCIFSSLAAPHCCVDRRTSAVEGNQRPKAKLSLSPPATPAQPRRPAEGPRLNAGRFMVGPWLGVIGLTVDETKTTLLRSKHGSSLAKNTLRDALAVCCWEHPPSPNGRCTALHDPFRFHAHRHRQPDQALNELDIFDLF